MKDAHVAIERFASGSQANGMEEHSAGSLMHVAAQPCPGVILTLRIGVKQPRASTRKAMVT